MSKEFQWTENIVAEFIQTKLHIQDSASFDLIEQFKESKISKPEWEIIQASSPECGLYYLGGYKMRPTDTIYSIKRLSDNSIWSIGDKFAGNAGTDITIKCFEAIGKIMKVWSMEYGYWYLDHIKKLSSFTTDDGVNVYKGSDIALLSTDSWLISFPVKAPEIPFKGDKGQFKYFSTKEAAEDYVLRNKPALSLSQVLTRYACVGGKNKEFIESIKELSTKAITPKTGSNE